MAEDSQTAHVDGLSSSPASASSSASPMSTSSHSVVFNEIDMNTVSFEDYMNMTNDRSAVGEEEEEAEYNVESPDTPMTGTDLPPTTPCVKNDLMDSVKGSSSTFKMKLLPARKTTPASTSTPSKSGSVESAFSPSIVAIPTAGDAARQSNTTSTVDILISRHPELLHATSKAQIVDTIVNSNVIRANSDSDDVTTYPIDYTQIEDLSDSILARSTHTGRGSTAEKGITVYEGPLGAEAMVLGNNRNAEINIDDAITDQEKRVMSLRKVLSDKLYARFQAKKVPGNHDSANNEGFAFRGNFITIKHSLYMNECLKREDGGLHSSIVDFEREENEFRLLKERKQKVEADVRVHTQKENPEEAHRRNMTFLEGDMPTPKMLFNDDYIDRHSSYDNIKKMRHMLKPDGPLMANYMLKGALKGKAARLTEEQARREAANKAHFASMLRVAKMKAAMKATSASMEILVDFEGGEITNADV
ncbi:uncharacterized protein RCO7_04395 [Rhynchosporium graminicola]|uniref:Uncharacterized protein n=1 Tax=Rhynchosporium graminicola TaxID=2792576 RepID=A0A1E1JRX5_9HELO|nr:uncharacterized protein RCO7_04395 [Rhynchosporium commune]